MCKVEDEPRLHNHKERRDMARNKQSVKLPNPANINPPVKSIRALEKKIATVLERKGRFGEKRQILNVESNQYVKFELFFSFYIFVKKLFCSSLS